jgi:hypothetical protein
MHREFHHKGCGVCSDPDLYPAFQQAYDTMGDVNAPSPTFTLQKPKPFFLRDEAGIADLGTCPTPIQIGPDRKNPAMERNGVSGIVKEVVYDPFQVKAITIDKQGSMKRSLFKGHVLLELLFDGLPVYFEAVSEYFR